MQQAKEGKQPEMKLWKITGPLVISLMVSMGLLFEAQTVSAQHLNTTVREVSLIHRLEQDTNRFERTVDSAMDRSRLDGTSLEDQVNALVDEFEHATNRLKDRADDNMVYQSDVREVMRRGHHIDRFMQTHRLAPAAERDWRRVRNTMDQLGRRFKIDSVWVPNPNSDLNRASTREIIKRLENATDEFRDSFDESLDRSRHDGTSYEDFLNNVVAKFERSLDRIDDQMDRSRTLDTAELRLALNNAATINDFVRTNSLSLRARSDWARVRVNLDDLAFLNQIAWNWTTTNPAVFLNQPSGSAQGERVAVTMTSEAASSLAREVRRELLTELPYYGVFDWIEFEVKPDRTVVLNGHVTAPPDTKSRAESVVKDISGVERVVNQIKVLPVSPNDDRLRRALYREIYGFDSPLFKYGVGSRQSIHIIVDGGRATLKGVVETEGDKQIAYAKARGVSGLFAVNNDLRVDSGRRY